MGSDYEISEDEEDENRKEEFSDDVRKVYNTRYSTTPKKRVERKA